MLQLSVEGLLNPYSAYLTDYSLPTVYKRLFFRNIDIRKPYVQSPSTLSFNFSSVLCLDGLSFKTPFFFNI